MKRLALILCLISALAYGQNEHKVHFILLIPTDRTFEADQATQAIGDSALHLQAWYQRQMDGKTFTYDVNTYFTSHDSTFYESTPCCLPWFLDPQELWWADNVLNEANQFQHVFTGSCQPYDSYVVYCDAPILPNQFADTWPSHCNPSFSSFTLLAESDTHGVMGTNPYWTQCRSIGGSGHEMGLGLGLVEPRYIGEPWWSLAIMGIGFTTYPDCILLQSDKDTLNQSPFFDYMPPVEPPAGLCTFDPTPTPSPTSTATATSTPTATATFTPTATATSTPTPTPTPTATPLAAPYANDADQIQHTSFRARWNAVNGATSYHLDVATDVSFLNYAYQDWNVGNVLNMVVTGLTRHTDYWYRVRAYNDVSSSPNSNVIHVNTK